MDEIVQEFLVESYENLDQLDRDLVALEQDPSSGTGSAASSGRSTPSRARAASSRSRSWSG
jgi:chemotaxis protein histidine kinase CheA